MKNLIFTLLILCSLMYGCQKVSNTDNTTLNQQILPLAPTDLNSPRVGLSFASLSWTDRSTNETGFKIERKTGAGNFSIVGNTSENTSSFDDTALVANSIYTYRVYSYNLAGNSLGYSNEITVKTLYIPPSFYRKS